MHEPDAILAKLGRFAAEIASERLPPDVVQKAKACLLYALAVGIASLRAPQPAQAARAIDRESSAGAGGATRIIDRRRLDFTSAAFCNSVLFHSRVQDDAHPAGHFGGVDRMDGVGENRRERWRWKRGERSRWTCGSCWTC